MTKFLSGCGSKGFFFILLVTVALISVSWENRADAGCGLFCGGSWYADSGEDSIVDKPSLSITNSIDGCNAPGETPPTGVKCELSATSTTVTNWKLTGSLTEGICSKVGINIGGTIGSTSTVTVAGGVGAVLTYFCQTCEAENGTRFKSTDYKIRCSCGSSEVLLGSVVEYVSPYIKGSAGHIPNPPCNPICPASE